MKPCPCGGDHSEHPLWLNVVSLIERHGETITVETRNTRTLVPRIWIAFHGLRSSELGALADRYGWSEAPSKAERSNA